MDYQNSKLIIYKIIKKKEKHNLLLNFFYQLIIQNKNQ